MSNVRGVPSSNVPEPTLRRLPWYLAYAQLVQQGGGQYLSSTQIAHNIAVDPSMVAKDLSYVNIAGRTRVGYEVNELVRVLERFLGFTQPHKAFLFGDFDVAEGDWVVPRVCDSAEPPEDARRVAKIARWTSRYRFHHLEVTAR